eukprot:g4363.t1
MQVSVETTTGLERRMTVELPNSEVDQEVNERLKKAAKTVRLDGFRKGKVPMNVMRQRFGASVRNEVLGEVINRSYGEAIQQEKVKPAGMPIIEPLDEKADGENLSYTAIFEVYPEIEIKDLSAVSVEKASAEVVDTDVEDMLETLRKQHSTWETVERAAQDDDQVVIDFVGTLDGEEFEGGKGEGTELVLGTGQMIPGFESGIVGMKAGETRNVEVTFPEDYQSEELKGKDAVFEIKVEEVKERSLPDIDKEFAEKFGVEDGDLAKLNDEIRKNMERELASKSSSYVKNQVMKAVAELHDVDLPKAMVKEEVGRVKNEMFQQYGGGANIDLAQFPDEPFVEQAESRVKLGLIISEIVTQAELKVDAERVKQEISTLAAGYEQPEQVEQYYYSNEEMMNSLRMKVLEDQMLKLPDGTLKILVEGQDRVQIDDIAEIDGKYLISDYEVLGEEYPDEQETDELMIALREELSAYAESSKKLPKEVMVSLNDINHLPVLVDSISMHLPVELKLKQQILELSSVSERAELVLSTLDVEADLQKVERRIRTRVKKQMEKSQREYYLNEQMKAIQKELGDIDGGSNEIEQIEEKIKSAKMTPAAEEKALAELNKMKMMSPMSAEASVLRNYIDWMLSIPWSAKTKLRHDLEKAEKILDADHYGLEEVKERILEFLAVQKRVRKLKGPILCLVGPPGVGKTSLGESIARATNRKFVRMSLGGVRDEAEIRGHRRTYIGSLPGKLIQKLSKVGVKNPLFLLDEIDKMGMDYRGDPASALLEVLDPEQNTSFSDHYLEIDYDLSDIMFVCTANSMNIPGPLLDRMEVIRLPGYTEDEKVAIADKYLVPKQVKANGLKKDELEITQDALRNILRHYTKEAGVRNFDREIAKLSRKVVMKNSDVKKTAPIKIKQDDLVEYLGVEKFSYGVAEENNQVGQVTGLAWTQVGGEILTIESSAVSGTGKIIKTGSLGDVMQESIQAALTVVRGRSESLGIDPEFYREKDIHIHIPEGATPKDGPSAGIGICTALISELTAIPAAHILVEVEDNDAHLSVLDEIQVKLEEGVDFAELAAEYSDDIGSSGSGGLLGYSDGASFPAEFEAELIQLEVGEVSGPVLTDAGVHIIKLMNVDQAEFNLEDQYSSLEQELLLEKAGDIYRQNLERLRDAAFSTDNLEQLIADFSEGSALLEGRVEEIQARLNAGEEPEDVARSEEIEWQVQLDAVRGTGGALGQAVFAAPITGGLI